MRHAQASTTRAEENAMSRRVCLLAILWFVAGTAFVLPAHAGHASTPPAGAGTGASNASVQTVAVVPGRPGDPQVRAEGVGAVTPFDMIGASWSGPANGVSARVKTAAGWQPWFALEANADLPDPGTPEARHMAVGQSSEPIWVGTASDFEVQAASSITDVQVHLVRSGSDPEPQYVAETFLPGGAPSVYLRSAWGANAPISAPSYTAGIKMAFVHHTAGPNNYSAADVPGIIRGIQAYEQSPAQGYNDIAYNFLVDKFGRIWEGRGGGIDKDVLSAATGGFNSYTVSVAAIGDFTSTPAPQAMVDSIAQVVGWKLGVNGVSPYGTATLTSTGNDRYPAGTAVTFNAVSGHRDSKPTECPGTQLYIRLDEIRGKANATAAVVANSPKGSVDVMRQTPQGLHVAGWTIDPNGTGPLEVDVIVDGTVRPTSASLPRADVGNAFPTFGPNHGFDMYTPVAAGDHQVCVMVKNWAAGLDTQLDCEPMHFYDSPGGWIDAVQLRPDGVHLAGWALDPDSGAPVDVHIHVDNVNYIVHADDNRPDIAAAHPEYGAAHGFSVVVPAPSQSLCVFVINVGPGGNGFLGCPSVSSSPTGYVDVLSLAPGGVRAAGWALDPNTASAISVRMVVDGRAVASATANGTRNDIAAAFPGYGASHGYSVVADPGLGTHTVCVDAVNTGVGGDVRLGCRVVTRTNDPIGYLDVVAPGPGGRRAAGWALDQNSSDPIQIHLHVQTPSGLQLVFGMANQPRPDVGAAYPFYGSAHGFDVAIPDGSTVCAYGINVGPGNHGLLGCIG
jgi:hypothetical protein